MRKKSCRKAINFDLDTKILESIFKNTIKPYSDIKKALLNLGFAHRQYSGYTSVEKMTEYDVTLAMQELNKKLPWLSTPGLIKKIDVTDIGKQYELSNLFVELPEIDKSKTQPTPPQKSTLSINDLIQATEEDKESELSTPGRDTPDVDERD